jgi:hypothetical protein
MPSRRDPEDGNVSRLARPVCETGTTTEIHRCLADFLIHSIADAIQSASAPVISTAVGKSTMRNTDVPH